MNWFRTLLLFILYGVFFLAVSLETPLFAQEVDAFSKPFSDRGGFIYADIDTTNQIVYLLLKEELWKFDLNAESWVKLQLQDSLPQPLEDFQFGYNELRNSLQLWSTGVGLVYEIDLESLSVERIDRSFLHKNQFGHYGFIFDGKIYAFGGYGLWDWHNLITFFNTDIMEWNIMNVDPDSPLPEKRIPDLGTFIADKQELLIVGGTGSELQRSDDKNVIKQQYYDVWKYTFKTATWKKIAEFDHTGVEFSSPNIMRQANPINSLSSSFHSNKSGIWYLPVTLENAPNEMFYVKPFHVPTATEYPVIELPTGDVKQYLVSNYLFDQKSNEVVLIALGFLTNSDLLPVQILKIPEDSLRQMISTKKAIPAFIYYLSGILIIGGLIFYFIWANRYRNNRQEVTITKEHIEQFDWLNDDERRMILILYEINDDIDTVDLEGKVWPTIENYDYRRKLRNETIKSINNKFEAEFPDKGKFIIRKKDPSDNRRYRYSLNKNLVS